MNINELRTNTRRLIQTRRQMDRRIILFAFNSPEWLENIKINYLVCPKFDRRENLRRKNERRKFDRRHLQHDYQPSLDQQYTRIFLTREERKLIQELYLCDFLNEKTENTHNNRL